MKKFLLLSLIISAESLASGVCIVCPPGYDCSGNNPALDGTTGQVLTRTAGGTAWQALPAGVSPYTSTPAALGTTGSQGSSANYARGDHVHPTTGLVSTTRKIFNKTLSGDITVGDLITERDSCNALPKSGHTIAWLCSDVSGTVNVAGYPGTPSGGRYCWCRLLSSKSSCGYSTWVYIYDLIYSDPTLDTSCPYNCESHCKNTTWRSSAVW